MTRLGPSRQLLALWQFNKYEARPQPPAIYVQYIQAIASVVYPLRLDKLCCYGPRAGVSKWRCQEA